MFLEVRRRCRHHVVGICPRCYPAESRTLRNKKLALAIAWLEHIAGDNPHIRTLDQVRRVAKDAREMIADLT